MQPSPIFRVEGLTGERDHSLRSPRERPQQIGRSSILRVGRDEVSHTANGARDELGLDRDEPQALGDVSLILDRLAQQVGAHFATEKLPSHIHDASLEDGGRTGELVQRDVRLTAGSPHCPAAGGPMQA